MGFFDGMSGVLGGGSVGSVPQYVPSPKVIIGHVLEVCISEDSPLYKGNDQNIGLILFRDVFGPPTKELGREIGKRALPADRSNFKIPLPGEQVVLYYAYSDQITPGNQNAPGYYYGSVIMNSANVTTTSSPFVGIEPSLLNPLNVRGLTYDQLESRFDKKIKNLETFKDSSAKPIIHKQLKPFEGDYILQGRFGNTIRFGGTPTDANAKNGPLWAQNKRGKPGDAIITMRLSNETISAKQAKNKLYDVEDINEDAASIYLTTTQEITMKLAIPDKGDREHPLASWAYTYGITAPSVLPSETHMFDGEQNAAGVDKKSVKQDSDPSQVVGQVNPNAPVNLPGNNAPAFVPNEAHSADGQ